MDLLYKPRCRFPEIVTQKYAVRRASVREAGISTEMIAELAHVTRQFGSPVFHGGGDGSNCPTRLVGHTLPVNGHHVTIAPKVFTITNDSTGLSTAVLGLLINPELALIGPETCGATDLALMIELAYRERRTPRSLRADEAQDAQLRVMYALHLWWIIEQMEWPELDAYLRNLYAHYGLDPELISPTQFPLNFGLEYLIRCNIERARLHHLLATKRKFHSLHRELLSRFRVWRTR